AESIRARIREEINLPCSIGIGPTKFSAKLLSGRAKPDGIAHWKADEVVANLRPLPLRDLWGAGPKTVEKLERFGFRTIGQVADADRRTLERVVGEAVGAHLHGLATGSDMRSVEPQESARSISAEQTYAEDVDDPELLERRLLALAEKVGRRLRQSELAARTISIKVRFASFETVTRSTTVASPTDRTHDLIELTRELLHSLRLERAQIRLLGVSASKLVAGSAARQMELGADVRWEDVDKVTDRVADRFKDIGITYASLLDEDDDDVPNRDGQ
ncbi:MAG: DNA polymerase-4, partial [Glaciecola sp.]